MAVSDTDIVHYQSAGAGSSGGAITGSSIASGVANNVWSDVTNPQRTAGIVVARKTFWKNNNGTDAMLQLACWTPTPPVNATLLIGLGVNSSDDADPAQGNMTAWSAAAKVALVSDTVGDARVVTVYGLDNSGSPVPTTETVTLSGVTEVLSATTYSKVFGWWVSTIDAGKIVTIKQGSGGTVRGTIGHSKKACWLWLAALSKTAGILLPDLAAGQNFGVWRQLTVAAGAGRVSADSLTIRTEENV